MIPSRIQLAPLLAAASLAVGLPTAGSIETWEGVWVVLKTEVYSDCADSFTTNRLAGEGVESSGARRFAPGETARIRSAKNKRRGIEVRLDLIDAVLVPRAAGPAVVHDERSCFVALEIEAPGERIRSSDDERIRRILAPVLDRFPTLEAARASPAWNRRAPERRPREEEPTEAEVRRWRTTRTAVALDQALALLRRSLPQSSESEYVERFARGMRQIRQRGVPACEAMLRGVVEPPQTWPPSPPRDRGRAFAYALGAVDRLVACAEAEATEAGAPP